MKSLAIITGASRGIGRSIALAITDAINSCASEKGLRNCFDDSLTSSLTPRPLISTPLRMVLISRSVDSLYETARLVQQRCDHAGIIQTSCHEIDLSDLDNLPEKFGRLLESCKKSDYDQCWLINNAGSLGPLGPASYLGSDASSMKELQHAVNLNITSGIWISSQFTKSFLKPCKISSSPLIRIVNVSSLCAIEPFPTMSIYCSGKAARDMFHSVLAKENAQINDDATTSSITDANNEKSPVPFKVLNYAPGACETSMTDILAESPGLDGGIHDYFSSAKKDQSLVKADETAKKLIGLVLKDEFESGSHVDYWDL